MLGFKAFDAAQSTLVGIELMRMIKKWQIVVEEGNEGLTAAELFTPWPPNPFHRQGQLPLHDLLSKICDKALFRPLKWAVHFLPRARELIRAGVGLLGQGHTPHSGSALA